MHDRFYGQQDGCEDWDTVGEDFTKIAKFTDLSAGARTLSVKGGAGGILASQTINIGGRQYKLRNGEI